MTDEERTVSETLHGNISPEASFLTLVQPWATGKGETIGEWGDPLRIKNASFEKNESGIRLFGKMSRFERCSVVVLADETYQQKGKSLLKICLFY